MEILDVTVPIRTGMVVYPGDPDVRLERVRSMAEGASNNLTRIDMGAHSGTHIDAPVHFIADGAGTEGLPVGVLLGQCTVVEADGLAESDVRAAPEGVERLLFKTPNSELWARDEFPEEFARLDGAGARLLVERGVALVGVDYLSVGDQEAHKVLLGAGVVCVEGLDLREAAPGEYFLVCAPLKLVGSDGAPARVFLVRGLGVSRQG